MNRVVITGMGLATPLGVGVDYCWNQLIAGHSGIVHIDHMKNISRSCVAGIVPNSGSGGFRIDDWVPIKNQKKISRFIALALCAAQQAINDANIENVIDCSRIGVSIGSGIGGLDDIARTASSLQEKGRVGVSPFFIVSNLVNLVSGQISLLYGFKGPNVASVTACASGAHAMIHGAHYIMLNEADVMVVGGTESALSNIGIIGFDVMRALSSNYNDKPQQASRPWDKGRDGFVISEGAGVLVLESYTHAMKRGAKIYAELAGYGATSDSYHEAKPDPNGEGGLRAMQLALNLASIQPLDIGYLNAHATSTEIGDSAELHAIHKLFGQHAYNFPISSTKSSIGHTLGAAGAIEAIFSVQTLRTGKVPPTLNLENPVDIAEGMNLVPFHMQEHKHIRYVLSNSFGFGGTNASLLFKKI